MPRTLVTGGAGFVGSHFCDLLLEKGHEVVCLDNFITGSRANIAHITDSRFEFIEHDVSQLIVIDGPLDYVVHMASPASPPDYYAHPIATLKAGSYGTHHTLELAKNKSAVFLITSTSEVYGDPHEHPQPETYWGNVNPIGPRSVYDEAKRYAEALTMAYHRTHRVDTRIARIFNTYGPRMRLNDGRAIPNFMHQALNGLDLTVYGDGSQTRSFCYVSDLVDGIHRLLTSRVTEPVNIGNPEEMTLIEMAEKILQVSGSQSKIVFKPLPEDDPRLRRPDIARARHHLKWEPRVDLETGLRATLDFFKQHMESPKT
ncbi:UDP-glucuronic acid decarboxylase family protein [Nitrospina watsonii]|uniref:UDP-glucuronate decarboxylase n=1 Tax=Nitrospina watsonii TaxID=1323948 RepID=A0ABN8VVE9_9BACT|nr:UDP-glucuronic acid decarboxylase family protein [Nitrospina watsonii]CAI2717165.1 dTDP-glucose 4,6-dehydratase [Nitrospina watsonii]